uniref:SH3 domain-containing protein n=2 Tax=Stomoxys calcitrans TaxID=35570 RepID=A0A1I8PT53_STOCA
MTSYVRALYEFSGEPGTSEISIAVGEVLQVLRTDVGEGWWEGKNSKGEVGLFPAAYVEVMSAAEAKPHQQPAISQNLSSDAPNAGRYDSMADDYNDGDDWEDDWDDDNDTYSEIGPSNNSLKQHDKHMTHSSSNYDNKNLPATPSEDFFQSSVSGNNNTSTLKKSSMFGKSSDSFILGLGNRDRLPDNELIYIVPYENFYQWQPNYQSYSVIVASPKKETKFKGMKTFIAYQLTPSFNNIS